MTTTRFQGESVWDAIVNDNTLDITEEARFEEFIRTQGASRNSPGEVLEDLFTDWEMFERGDSGSRVSRLPAIAQGGQR